LYQETKSLNRKDRNYVLSAEMELTKIFENILAQGIKEKTFNIDKHTAKIVANNIMVQGQMWSFRRWVAQKNYSLNNYIQIQTDLIINAIS